MKLTEKIKEVRDRYFGEELPVEKKLFYTTCVLGIMSSFSGFLSSAIGRNLKFGVVVNFIIFILISSVCIYGFYVENTYKVSIFLCLALNFIIFPILFFLTGGLSGGAVAFFILGTFLTEILLKGILRSVVFRITILWYIVVLKVSNDYPILVFNVSGESKLLFSIYTFVMITLFIYYTTNIFIRSYNKNQKIISDYKFKNTSE